VSGQLLNITQKLPTHFPWATEYL